MLPYIFIVVSDQEFVNKKLVKVVYLLPNAGVQNGPSVLVDDQNLQHF